jgi:hypothetical protein
VREGVERGEADARCAAGEGRDSLGAELHPAELWVARVRAGLVALLGFLEDEPQLGRLLVGRRQPLDTAGLGWEQPVSTVLAELLASEGLACGYAHDETSAIGSLHHELVVGGLMAAIEARVRDREDGRLVELAPSLTTFAATSYPGQTCASAELAASESSIEGELSALSSATSVRWATEGIELFKRLPGCTAYLYIQAASAHSHGGGRSRCDALFQTGGVGGSPGGGLARRSIGNREDKGVVDK